MRTINTQRYPGFDEALKLLDYELSRSGAPSYNLVICGGSALIAARLIQRATKDVDILALRDECDNLIDPAPLPEPLEKAARVVAENLSLPADWLNNGPSSGDGGIFRLGLPEGLASRLTETRIGEKLTINIISRIDQIFLKLYAAVDQFGGYHADDLEALNPSDDELVSAAQWSISHDPSDGYRQSMRQFLNEFGYRHAAERI